MAMLVVAEDDGDIRALLTRILRKGGHTVVAVPDGAAGLQAVREHTPDLLVTDIDMPIMSGFDLCRAVRDDPATAGLPVLFVSGKLVPGDTRPAEVEATALLHKPFLPAQLVACVHRLLQDGHQPGGTPATCP